MSLMSTAQLPGRSAELQNALPSDGHANAPFHIWDAGLPEAEID
jgi:hypothetical protein